MSSHFDETAWQHLTIFEQMGNIGSEVGRALKAKHNGDTEAMQGAFFRGMDLLNATAQFWAQRRPGRVREILLARELFASSVLSDKEDSGIEKYFMDFALTARMQR